MLDSVLLVDDNPLDNLLHSRALLKAGVVEGEDRIRTASDGQDGVEMLQRAKEEGAEWFPPDLILVDVHMPRMNGFEFVEGAGKLVEGGRRPCSIVLMVTSSQDAEDKQRAAGNTCIREFIPKPLTAAVAGELVARHRRR